MPQICHSSKLSEKQLGTLDFVKSIMVLVTFLIQSIIDAKNENFVYKAIPFLNDKTIKSLRVIL